MLADCIPAPPAVFAWAVACVAFIVGWVGHAVYKEFVP